MVGITIWSSQRLSTFLLASSLLLTSGCGFWDDIFGGGDDFCVDLEAFDQETEGRGRAISASCLGVQDRAELAAKFGFIGIPSDPKYSVAVYQLIYQTIDPAGQSTTASGAVVIPINGPDLSSLVAYLHGTVALRTDVPSFGSLEQDVGVVYGALGYVAASPDLLGLGVDDTRLHPYVHADSEASATIDLLRATRALISTLAIEDNGDLFLTGYSQGGHAVMAIHREVESNHSDEFTVVASAPGAGPYDMSGTMLDFVLAGNEHPNPYYFPYVLLAYRPIYDVVPSDEDYFIDSLKSVVPPLYDGTHSSSAINAELPPAPIDALDAVFVDAVRTNPDHPFRAALRDNDVYDWTPSAPVRLYHCSGDLDVMPENSQVAFDQLQANGATVELIEPVEGGDHSACSLPTLFDAQEWFDTF